MIRENFVSVIAENYIPGNDTEMAWYEKTGGAHNGYIAVTATGRKLGDVGQPEDLQRMLDAFRRLPASERKPDPIRKGVDTGGKVPPKPPPGALSVIVYCTALEGDGKGGWARARRVLAPGVGWAISPALTLNELLWVAEDEWKAFVPVSPRKGQRIDVPSSLQRRIFLFYGFEFGYAHSSFVHEKLRSGGMTATVEEATPQAVRIRLEGSSQVGVPFETYRDCRTCTTGEWCPHLGADARYFGILNYDLTRKRFDRFDIAAVGESWGELDYYRGMKEGPVAPADRRRWAFGLAFTLSSERPADRGGWPNGAAAYRGWDYWQRGR